MKIKNIFLVSVFMLPSLVVINAQASEPTSQVKTFQASKQQSNDDHLKVKLASAKNLLEKTEAAKEKKLISLKKHKKTTIKQKKSLYRSNFSQAKFTMKRELKKINHSDMSPSEKSRKRMYVEKDYKEKKSDIEKQQKNELDKLTKKFDERIKSSKIKLEKRISSLNNTILLLQERMG
jgi:hypothetical protein